MEFYVCLLCTTVALPSRLSYFTRVRLSLYKKSSFHFKKDLPVRHSALGSLVKYRVGRS